MDNEKFISDLLKEDELGSVIRAHLYIEYFVDQIIQLIVPYPDKLKPLNLDFHGKINLLMALGVDPEIKKPLSIFGGLRNNFSHRLNYQLTKSEINNLYEALSSQDKERLQSCYSDIVARFPSMNYAQKFSSLNTKDQFVFLALAVKGVISSTLTVLKNRSA
jgi:hypothetical protein